MTSSAQRCDSLHLELSQALSELAGVLQTAHNASDDDKIRLVEECKNKVDESDRLIASLERETERQPKQSIGKWLFRVNQHEQQLQDLTTKTRRLQGQTKQIRDKRAFMENGSGGGNQRNILMQQNNQLDHTSDRLMNTQRIAEESVEIGADTLSALHGQRQQLENSKNKLNHADHTLAKSSRVLRTMWIKAIGNKILLIAIVILLLCILGFVVWYRFYR